MEFHPNEIFHPKNLGIKPYISFSPAGAPPPSYALRMCHYRKSGAHDKALFFEWRAPIRAENTKSRSLLGGSSHLLCLPQELPGNHHVEKGICIEKTTLLLGGSSQDEGSD